MTNSKDKGSRNERGVAKLFTQWTGYEFSRTPQSGGLHWQKQNTIGDIVCIDEKHSRRFQFSIECKFHAEVDFSYLIDTTRGKVSNKFLGFWDQAARDAIKVNKVPLLFVRRNMMQSDTHFVAMPAYFFHLLLPQIEPWENNYGILTYVNGTYNFVIMNSLDLFKIPYITFHKTAFKLNKHGKEA